MHTGPVPGIFEGEWQPTKNPLYKCRCGSSDINFRIWESVCGGYEDINYRCNSCKREWWVESSDS